MQHHPFGGLNGLKIRLFGLLLFIALALFFGWRHDHMSASWFGIYGLIGLIDTIRYFRRLR